MLCEGMDIGGCETHVYELTLALTEASYEVTLVCAGGCYANMLRERGVRIVLLPTNRRNPLSLLYTALSLRQLCRDESFDVVHAHTRGMALLARKFLSVPLCVTAHLDFHTNRLLRHLCYFGEATLAVSEDIREYLLKEYRIDPSQIALTHNGVDLAHFAEGKNARGIVHLSRLDRDRSLCACLLCEIAPYVLRGRNGMLIHIFGDGNDFTRVKSAAEAANRVLGYEGVVLHGATSDIRSALSHGNIFVGASRAAIEAMASRHATVVAGNDGYGGMVNEQRLPLLLRSNFCARGMLPTDARKLAIDLTYLLNHSEQARVCADFCRRVAEKYYNREGMARDALSAYGEAISRYQGRATLVGYYGYGNFGDTLTLEALCRELPYRKIYIPYAGREKGKPQARENKKIYYTGRYLGVFRAILHSHEVIFGGGTLFQNTTSTRSLMYYSMIAFFSRLMRRRLRLIAGGVDGIRGRLPRAIAKRALLCFDTLSVRTERDRENLVRLTENRSVAHLPDAVFLHTPKKARMLPYATIILNAQNEHLGLSDFLCRLRRVGLTPLFVVLFSYEDEEEVLRLCDKHGVRAATKKDSEEIFSLLAHATLTVSERLHGAIASIQVHRPCFLLSSSEKTAGLCEDVSRVARSCEVASPLIPFRDYAQITDEMLQSVKKEAAGKTYGFDKIIGFFKECWRTRLMPLLQQLPLQEQVLPQREPPQRQEQPPLGELQ